MMSLDLNGKRCLVVGIANDVSIARVRINPVRMSAVRTWSWFFARDGARAARRLGPGTQKRMLIAVKVGNTIVSNSRHNRFR
jgi:hypothetical protein